jgi:hypothetical protein
MNLYYVGAVVVAGIALIVVWMRRRNQSGRSVSSITATSYDPERTRAERKLKAVETRETRVH